MAKKLKAQAKRSGSMVGKSKVVESSTGGSKFKPGAGKNKVKAK